MTHAHESCDYSNPSIFTREVYSDRMILCANRIVALDVNLQAESLITIFKIR